MWKENGLMIKLYNTPFHIKLIPKFKVEICQLCWQRFFPLIWGIMKLSATSMKRIWIWRSMKYEENMKQSIPKRKKPKKSPLFILRSHLQIFLYATFWSSFLLHVLGPRKIRDLCISFDKDCTSIHSLDFSVFITSCISRRKNIICSVCFCLPVYTLTAEPLDLRPWYLAWNLTKTLFKMGLKVKVIGQRLRSNTEIVF